MDLIGRKQALTGPECIIPISLNSCQSCGDKEHCNEMSKEAMYQIYGCALHFVCLELTARLFACVTLASSITNKN